MFVPEAAMMTIHLTSGCTIVDTVAASDEMTIAGIEETPTMTQTFGIPMNTIGKTAVTEASTAAAGNTDGEGDVVAHSAAHLHSTAAGEPRVQRTTLRATSSTTSGTGYKSDMKL